MLSLVSFYCASKCGLISLFSAFMNTSTPLFRTGKNGSIWYSYSLKEVPVSYLPPSFTDPSIQERCQTDYAIAPGEGAVIVFNGTEKVLCSAAADVEATPMCDIKAYDSFNNPRLCSGESIESDPRPDQTGTPCTSNLKTTWLDLVLIVDVSKHVTGLQLDALSQSLIETFSKLTFDKNTRFSSRISLITYSTFAKTQFELNEIKNADQLKKLLDLRKYSQKFDAGRNSKL